MDNQYEDKEMGIFDDYDYNESYPIAIKVLWQEKCYWTLIKLIVKNLFRKWRIK